MAIAVICTGTELLKGSAVNTNMAYLGRELCAAGIPAVLELTIGDHPSEIVSALSFALRSADTIILSGGLGPTDDDLTLDVAARFFGIELTEDKTLRNKLLWFWKSRHQGPCPKAQFRQARVPVNGGYIPNPVGSASGLEFAVEFDSVIRHVYLLPGPPREFEPMVKNELLPRLIGNDNKKIFTDGFMVCAGESSVFPPIKQLLTDVDVEVACAAGAGGVRMFISGSDENIVKDAVQKAYNSVEYVKLPIGKFDLNEELLNVLAEKSLHFGCAESCTGGMVADKIVALPGASKVFNGGIIAYANAVKQLQLGVSEEILSSVGAVSKECAEAMARGCCKQLNCECAVATTGIAGPDGGTAEKPVGLVYIAAVCNEKCVVRELRAHGDRRAVRERAAAVALQLMYEVLTGQDA